MKLCSKAAASAILVLLGSVAYSADAKKSSLRVVENFLTEEEIQSFRNIDANERGLYDNRRHGRALAESHLVQRLEEAGAVSPGQTRSGVELKTSVLTKTSRPHTDIAYPPEGGTRRVGKDDGVVFVFLNSNPQAKFVFGEEHVPVVAGNMVRFDGHEVRHNTIVEGGEVHLLGPFESRKLVFIGEDHDINGAAYGDPHFKTWVGEKYDFHGECDLDLVVDPSFFDGKGLRVAIRTKIVRNWSFIDTAALQIGNDILEVQGGADVQNYWVNGKYQADLEQFSDFSVTYKKPHSHGHLYTIALGSGDTIEVRTYRDFVRVDFKNPTMKLYGKTVGLLGDFFTGKKLARDGTTVLEDPIQFGREWQVQPGEANIFHEIVGPQLPHQMCVMPEELNSAEKNLRGRRLEAAQITEDMAKRACEAANVAEEDFDACVFDVVSTDSVDSAGAY